MRMPLRPSTACAALATSLQTAPAALADDVMVVIDGSNPM